MTAPTVPEMKEAPAPTEKGDGVVVVPREPTSEMVDAAVKEVGNVCGWEVKTIYRAMIAATQQATGEGVGSGAIFALYATWPEDVRRKLSMHDLRRMGGWRPSGDLNITPSPEALAKIEALSRSCVAGPEIRSMVVGSEATQQAVSPPEDQGSSLRDTHRAAETPVVALNDGWRLIRQCPTDGKDRLLRLPDGSEVIGHFSNPPGHWRVRSVSFQMRTGDTERCGVKTPGEPYRLQVYDRLPENVFPTHFKDR